MRPEHWYLIAGTLLAAIVMIVDELVDAHRPKEASIVPADTKTPWWAWITGPLFVVAFFGALIFMGHGAGF